MYRVSAIVALLLLASCTRKSATSESQFSADIRILTPFTQPSTQNGKLYISNGRLRVDLGSMVIVYRAASKTGWEMFPRLKQYLNIGEKQVSTFLPTMTNGSPCPSAQNPSRCKFVSKDSIEGRTASKWELINQHGERVYLWTDDALKVAVKWQIENVTYQVTGIHEGEVSDDLFDLPDGYTKAPDKWAKALGVGPN